MTADDRKKIYALLAAPFPEECVQRTDGKTTGKGYNTTGIGYQFIVNRINEVLGVGCFRAHRTITVKEITRPSGRAAFEAICDLTLELGEYVEGQFVTWAESLADGGHVASSYADAQKGAYTNAFKKAAAFFGVGRQAYEGSLDDDNLPGNEAIMQPVKRPAPPPQRPQQPKPLAQKAPVPQQSGTQHVTVPQQQPQVQPAPSNGPVRNRITSKQLGAIWALSRKAGYAQSDFRARIKQEYKVTLEFLDRETASTVIKRLQLSAPQPNGHAEAGAVSEPGVER